MRFIYIRLISDAHIKIFISQTSTKLKSIEDPKFQKVMPNKAKVIYAWDKKILSFSKNSKFCKQESLFQVYHDKINDKIS